MVSDAEANKETVTDQSGQQNDRQIVMQPSIDTDDQRLSTGSRTTSQSNPASVDDNSVDIQSSSTPSANPHPSHSSLDSVEQEFVPLIDADGELRRVSSSDAQDVLTEKNAGLEKPFAKNGDGLHFAEENKVKNDHVAGSEPSKQTEKEFHGDEDEEEDDDDVDDDEMDEEDEGDDDDDDDDVDNSNNANINADISVSSEKQLDEMKDVDAKSKGSIAADSSQPVDPAAGVTEQSSGAVNWETTVESGYSGLVKTQDYQTVTQQAAVSSENTNIDHDSNPQGDVNVGKLQHSVMDRLSHSDLTGKDFTQRQADITDHRGRWHESNQPRDMRFHPSEFDQRLHPGAHPPMVWKYVHSSPGEEFHNSWPEMQEAYRSWPEQQHHMNLMTDDRRFVQRDQKQFVNQHFDNRWSHVSQEDNYHLQNQRARSNQLYGQIPNYMINQWPKEDVREHVHYRDMLNNQQHYDHRYHYQKPDVRQPYIHVDQVYQQHPLCQRYMNSVDDKNSYSERVDTSLPSVRSNKQAVWQAEFSVADEEHRLPADKAQFDMPHVDQGSQRPSSVQFLEKAEDLVRPLQADNQLYQGNADVSSLSQKYAADSSQPSSPVLGRQVDTSVPSASSSKQAAQQPEFSSVDEEQRSPADKTHSDMSHVGQGTSSSQFSEKDVAYAEAEDLARPLQTNNNPHEMDADVSSLSQKYTEDTLQPSAPVLGRRSGHISGE